MGTEPADQATPTTEDVERWAYLTIQPAPRVDHITEDGTELTQLPYPFHAGKDGVIQRQEFWEGKPLRVLGFSRDLAKQQINLWWPEAWTDPERAIGMYVVTENADHSMQVTVTAVDSMTKGQA